MTKSDEKQSENIPTNLAVGSLRGTYKILLALGLCLAWHALQAMKGKRLVRKFFGFSRDRKHRRVSL